MANWRVLYLNNTFSSNSVSGFPWWDPFKIKLRSPKPTPMVSWAQIAANKTNNFHHVPEDNFVKLASDTDALLLCNEIYLLCCARPCCLFIYL